MNMYIYYEIPLPVLFLVLCANAKSLSGVSDELIPITSCRVPLESCSASSEIVTYRTLCMTYGKGCPDGTSYLCGLDSTGKYIIEHCQPDLECHPGTAHQYVVNQTVMTMELKCLPCQDGSFEPEYSRSSRSSLLLGCTYKHEPSINICDNLVLFENGTKSRATKWFCDIENEFYEQDGNMFCDDVTTKPCNCVRKKCHEGYLLRPDGRCIRCNTKLDPNNNFRCIHKDSNNISHLTTAGKAKRTFQQSNDDSQFLKKKILPKVDDEDEKAINSSEKDKGTGTAAVLLVCLAIVAVPVVIFLGKQCWFRCSDLKQKHYQRVRAFVISMVGRSKNIKGKDNQNGCENGSVPEDGEVTADKNNSKQNTRTNCPIRDSRDGRNTRINNSQTTDNSKSVQNGDIIHGTLYKDCVFKQCSHTEPNTLPPPYNYQRSEQYGEGHSVPRMHTLKSDYIGHFRSLEMDHHPESEHSDQGPSSPRMNTLKSSGDNGYTAQQTPQKLDHIKSVANEDDKLTEDSSLLPVSSLKPHFHQKDCV